MSDRCWYCGNEIPERKFQVTERLLDYGVFCGRHEITAIHRSCYLKAREEGGIVHYFVKGLEVVEQAGEIY